MSKPEDIPQDVWSAAIAASNKVFMAERKAPVCLIIARAILSEREACAQVADWTASALLSIYEGDGAAGARDAAAAIRKREG